MFAHMHLLSRWPAQTSQDNKRDKRKIRVKRDITGEEIAGAVESAAHLARRSAFRPLAPAAQAVPIACRCAHWIA
jgi:hypothetical protein